VFAQEIVVPASPFVLLHIVMPLVQAVWQEAATHTIPAPQIWPHAPQLAGSTFSSTQRDPHLVAPPPQTRPHAPALQTSPAWHALPQAPQLASSVATSTQLVPHAFSLALQAEASVDASGVTPGFVEDPSPEHAVTMAHTTAAAATDSRPSHGVAFNS
jgi:hypothetical protein